MPLRENARAMTIAVREIDDGDTARWTEFVSRRTGANLYHTLQWRAVVEDVFHHRPVYLMAERGGRTCGVLPLFRVAAPLLGSKLISLPYDIGSGGPLAEDDETEYALVEHAVRLARDQRANHLELRCDARHGSVESLRFGRSEPVLISDMILDDEIAVRARIRTDQLKAVRKAERRGIVVREAESLEDYRRFYEIYLRVFRAFGTPPYGAGYFPAVWQRLHPTGSVRLLLACAASECVGGLLLFRWRRNLVSKFAACLPKAVPLRAYAALYWSAIRLGLELSCVRLSWGTSSRDQRGLIAFKERWGAETRPAVVYGLPVRGRVPDLERYYSSEALTRRMWRKLPIRATRIGGGPVNRWFC